MKKKISNFETAISPLGLILAVIFSLMFLAKYALTYFDLYSCTLILDSIVSIAAFFFIFTTLTEINWLPLYLWIPLVIIVFLAPLVIAIIVIVCTWGDIAAITDYLGTCSAYLGVVACFLTLYNDFKRPIEAPKQA